MKLNVDILSHRTCGHCGDDCLEINPGAVVPVSPEEQSLPRPFAMCGECLTKAKNSGPAIQQELREAMEQVYFDNLATSIAAG